MFCPSCGMEERFSNQFCRACGADLRPVRLAVSKVDGITASAISAREEISRAFAQKIRDTRHGADMKIVAEDVLPQIEKFLESPEERRLRRIRVGSIISFIGLGAAIAFSIIASIKDDELLVVAGAGFITLCIGLAFVINGLLFTVPKKELANNTFEGENQRQLDQLSADTNELILPPSSQLFTSVVEETTQHLNEKQPVSRN